MGLSQCEYLLGRCQTWVSRIRYFEFEFSGELFGRIICLKDSSFLETKWGEDMSLGPMLLPPGENEICIEGISPHICYHSKHLMGGRSYSDYQLQWETFSECKIDLYNLLFWNPFWTTWSQWLNFLVLTSALQSGVLEFESILLTSPYRLRFGL